MFDTWLMPWSRSADPKLYAGMDVASQVGVHKHCLSCTSHHGAGFHNRVTLTGDALLLLRWQHTIDCHGNYTPVSCIILASVHTHCMLQLVLAPLHHRGLVGHHDCCTTHSEDGIGDQVVLHSTRVEAVCCNLRWHKQSNAVGVCLMAQQKQQSTHHVRVQYATSTRQDACSCVRRSGAASPAAVSRCKGPCSEVKCGTAL